MLMAIMSCRLELKGCFQPIIIIWTILYAGKKCHVTGEGLPVACCRAHDVVLLMSAMSYILLGQLLKEVWYSKTGAIIKCNKSPMKCVHFLTMYQKLSRQINRFILYPLFISFVGKLCFKQNFQ